jgi:hypothetical protein
MKILVRSNKGQDWQLVESAGYAGETELQGLLAESPSLISIDEIREGAPPLVVAVREVGLPGSGQTDLLAFNAQGDIAIVECKLAANPEIKRKVIAQVLEYGAYLWNMTYEELNDRVYQRKNQHLAELVSTAVDDPEWDEEAFRNAIEENLSKGSFILVIAVDEMNDELKRTMLFLNTCGNPEFAFTVLEMKRFQKNPTEILVPQLHGDVVKSHLRSGRKGRRQWTKDEFFTEIEGKLSSDLYGMIEEIYLWSNDKADRVWFGTGVATGSFTFHYQLPKGVASIFSIYTSGQLVINYGWLSRRVNEELLNEFHSQLTRIESFNNFPAEFNSWPSIRIEDAFMTEDKHYEQFKQVIENFGEMIKG